MNTENLHMWLDNADESKGDVLFPEQQIICFFFWIFELRNTEYSF